MAANNSNTNISPNPGIAAAQAIAYQNYTPIQRASLIANGTIPPDAQSMGMPFYDNLTLPNKHLSIWGPAININAGARAASVGNIANGEPPVLYYMFLIQNPNGRGVVPQVGGRPNALYAAAAIAAAAAAQNQSMEGKEGEGSYDSSGATDLAAIVDEVIQESNEVVTQIMAHVDPVAPPVDTAQDVIKPPAAITPTELVLENQASCNDKQPIQDINIEIINEINVQTNVTSSYGDINYTDAVVVSPDTFIVKFGCMDPDATNYDPEASINDVSLCKYQPPEAIKGCIDVNALNYDAEATEDDGSCVYEPKLPPIPIMSQFLDSHGQVVFEIPKDLVEKEGKIKLPKGSNVRITATRDLVNPNSPNPIVRSARSTESDLLLTVEEDGVGARKRLRAQFKKLASDTVEQGSEDIVIYNVVDDTSITRNVGGAIMITTNSPILTTSLQSQAFTYGDFKNVIDTSFSELVGKI
tara:strand:+ start:9972 stop:11381 length:1410 start_codon:yes stop_codon:yes gene_type:complete